MKKMKKENLIKESKRIVIKIGSSLLIDKNEGNLKSEWLRFLAQEINQLIKQKKRNYNRFLRIYCTWSKTIETKR